MLEKSGGLRVPCWVIFACLGLLCFSIGLMAASLATPNWVYQGKKRWGIDMSLYKCNDCPLFAGDWSWRCFSRWFCEINSGLEACVFFDEGTKANTAYISLEVIALVAAVMLLEKLVAYQFQRDYGSPVSLYAVCILMVVMHTLATLLWFGISNASLSSACASNDDKIISGHAKMCASSGPTLAIAALISCFMTMLLFFIVFYNRQADVVSVGVETGSVFTLPIRTLMYIVLLLQVLAGIFILSSLYVKDWVNRNSSQVNIKGGLLECHNCDEIYKDFGWDCFAGNMCEVDSRLGYCIMYEDLKEAGRTYISLAVASLMMILLWVQSVLFVIQGREYGSAYLNYFYAISAVLLEVFAISLWFSLSKSKLSSGCEKKISDIYQVPEVCSSVGPGLAITAIVLLVLAAVMYIVAFYNRGQSYIKQVSMRFSELQEDIELASGQSS